ncbi:MAG: intracellular septation protein [Francisellaceae bacterium]|nr:intracellular septation protein [Francisellaceae bacterium]
MLKVLSEFFPIILFFISFKVGGIYGATVTAMAACLIQVIWGRVKKGHFEKLPLISLFLICVFGGATLFFKNEWFIKLKPTALYWILSLAFIINHLIGRQTIAETMMGKNISLPQPVWSRLNMSWGVFFLIMGILNLVIVYQFDTQTWVNFKLFGTLILTLIFVVGQGFFISKHLELNKKH